MNGCKLQLSGGRISAGNSYTIAEGAKAIMVQNTGSVAITIEGIPIDPDSSWNVNALGSEYTYDRTTIEVPATGEAIFTVQREIRQ